MAKKILLGLTTTSGSGWKEKVKEIDKFDIKEIALFPTVLKFEERQELYKLLENTGLEKIPHVHLRDDMKVKELDYFAKRFKTEVFNIHPTKKCIDLLDRSGAYRNEIFVENMHVTIPEFNEALEKCAGACLDVSHWEDALRLRDVEAVEEYRKAFENNRIGCCHISAIGEESHWSIDYTGKKEVRVYDKHFLDNLAELDYVKKYLKYLPNIISIELENPFEEQLKAKEYLEKIIN